MRPDSRARRLVVALLAGGAMVAATLTPALAVAVVGDGTDDDITSGACVRHDGGTDQAIDHCNDDGTSEDPDEVADDGDVDSNDGGSRRQANEPFAIFDPTDPQTIVAGWNDYSMADLGAGW